MAVMDFMYVCIYKNRVLMQILPSFLEYFFSIFRLYTLYLMMLNVSISGFRLPFLEQRWIFFRAYGEEERGR